MVLGHSSLLSDKTPSAKSKYCLQSSSQRGGSRPDNGIGDGCRVVAIR